MASRLSHAMSHLVHTRGLTTRLTTRHHHSPLKITSHGPTRPFALSTPFSATTTPHPPNKPAPIISKTPQRTPSQPPRTPPRPDHTQKPNQNTPEPETLS